MTIAEVQAATAALKQAITTLVQEFEQTTGCIVHSVPVLPATATQPAIVNVKVQIP